MMFDMSLMEYKDASQSCRQSCAATRSGKTTADRQEKPVSSAMTLLLGRQSRKFELRRSTDRSHHLFEAELANATRRLSILSAEQFEALMLVAVGGCSYDDAAFACDCAESTVRRRVSQARKLLMPTSRHLQAPAKHQ
jgi:DNA-directed RNA polymerase specialized sigma24 family protein